MGRESPGCRGEAGGQSLHAGTLWLNLQCDCHLPVRKATTAAEVPGKSSSILRAEVRPLGQWETHPWTFPGLLPESVLVWFEFAFTNRHTLVVSKG